MLKPARFLDPKSDIVFKRIFGEHPHLLKSFLNAIMPIESPIAELEYLPVEQTPRIPVLKNTIVDVKCQDEQGRIFIVEMQLQWTTYFMQRLLFGASKAYVQQLRHGENYSSLYPVYGLGLINQTFDHKTSEWFHHYRTVNVKDPQQILEGLELIFVELPKFQPQTWNDRKLGVLWLRFLKETNERFIDVPQEFFEQPEISLAMELAQESGYSPGELEGYDKYWDALRVESTLVQAAVEKGMAQGMAQGIEQGMAQGIEQGMAQGIERGMAQGIEQGMEKGRQEEKEAIARKLKAQGMDLEAIAAVTGFSLDHLKTFV